MNIKSKLYRPFKIEEDPCNILFWGCTHYNHNPSWEEPIWKKRGHTSAEHSRESLINNWNSKANDNTIGFLLGDIMFGRGGKEEFISIINRHSFKELYVCSGNHFAGFNFCLEDLTDNDGNYFFSENKKLIFCPNLFEACINKQNVVMSHYPILSFNGQSKGYWHLFSHVHGNLGGSDVGSKYLSSGAKIYEVSVEKNPYPISMFELKKIMDKKHPTSFDHH